MPRSSAVVVFVAFVCSACGAAAERAEPADFSVVRAQLDTLWLSLAAAMTAADTAAVADFYTDSAYFAETGMPTARGRSAIVAATAGVFACCRYLESRQQIELLELVGNRALQFGTYRDVIEPIGQAPLAFFGRFDAVLERDTANRWRISRLVVIRDSSAQLTSRAR